MSQKCIHKWLIIIVSHLFTYTIRDIHLKIDIQTSATKPYTLLTPTISIKYIRNGKPCIEHHTYYVVVLLWAHQRTLYSPRPPLKRIITQEKRGRSGAIATITARISSKINKIQKPGVEFANSFVQAGQTTTNKKKRKRKQKPSYHTTQEYNHYRFSLSKAQANEVQKNFYLYYARNILSDWKIKLYIMIPMVGGGGGVLGSA